jgi:glutaminyl-tRNA synthetase
MPTISGMRRRGVTPEGLRAFATRIGVTTSFSWVDVGLLEETIREDLEPKCPRRMVVLYPLKVVIEDYPEAKVEELEAANHPSKPELGSRVLKFSREIYINQDDFNEDPPAGYFRLMPGGEVKLRYSYVIKLQKVIKDKAGKITELRCTHDPATRDGMPEDRKVKGVIHWVSAKHCVTPAAVNLYDYLLSSGNAAPGAEAPPAEQEKEDEEEEETEAKTDDFMKSLNPESLVKITDAKMEESLGSAVAMDTFQFERTGYFVVDKYSKKGSLKFNRTVGLKESAHKPDKEVSTQALDRKAAQAKAAAEKEAKKSMDPREMFRGQTDLYSKFDDDGVPTHGADGEALPKARVKKLRAEWDKQKKLFEKS